MMERIAAEEGILRSLGVIKSSHHTPVYMMHKFWARRPWLVFRTIIERFTKEGDIILDPFAGGGVTLVEGLISRRKVVAVDLNPLACRIMRCEVEPLNVKKFEEAVSSIRKKLEPVMNKIYEVGCPKCDGRGVVDWTEYDSSSDEPIQMKMKCGACGFSGIKRPEPGDLSYIPEPQDYPKTQIQQGDKTSDLLKRGYRYFHELFTKRNLAALTFIRKEILEQSDPRVKDFLQFAFSSTLKWASKMSHRRGTVVEGWAMHAYWIYPKYLEINVWKQFLNRCEAVKRGKEYTNDTIGDYAIEAKDFNELKNGNATYMIIQGDARKLPLPDGSIDIVITDPPYGGNVNYAELSDYFLAWFDETAPKEEEIIIHKTRGKTLEDYEDGLYRVFKECRRVLRNDGLLISTFNSKDLRIVTSFLLALRRAGFLYLDTSFQPYLKTYQTTFHAIQVDSMPFDFVFAFRKSEEGGVLRNITPAEVMTFLKNKLIETIKNHKTEKDFRLATYPYMIQVINHVPENTAKDLSKKYEELVESQRGYFSKVRKSIIRQRRNKHESSS